jgi:hypothetical protein
MNPQVSRSRRADPTLEANRRAETLTWLANVEAGCPACRRRDRDVGRWVESFASEHHADLAVITSLRASRGFCAAHTRRLLANPSASSLLGTVYGDVLPAAAAELAARPGSIPVACPACIQADGATTRVFSQLRLDLVDESVRAAYESHGGLCVPDALEFAAGSSTPAAAFVLGVVRRRLDGEGGGSGSADSLVDLLAGLDADAPRRDGLRRSEHNTVVDNYRTQLKERQPRRRLMAMLGDDACPVCTSGAQQLFGRLGWLAHVDATDVRPEELLLCAMHVRDVALADDDAGRRAAAAIAEALRGRLERLLDRLSEARSGDWSKPDRATGDGVLAVAALSVCRLCASVDQGMQRGIEMVVSMLGDPAVSAAFSTGHGVCLRHAHAWVDTATVQQVRQTAHRRIVEMGWELTEAKHKSVWWNRHELRGSETTAWQRAPELLDGWVYLGVGAPR